MPTTRRRSSEVLSVVGIALLLIVGGTTGCASSSALAVVLTPVPASIDTIWYVSARARVDGRDSRQLSDTLEYGLARYARERMDDASTSAIKVTLRDSVRLTRDQFLRAIRETTLASRSADPFAVLYVHGFGTSLHEGWQYAAEARIRTRHDAPWIVFCWPANGLGVTWPTSDALLTRAYHDDIALALASRSAFVRAAQDVAGSIGGSRVLLTSHSLGSSVVAEALMYDAAWRATLEQSPLRATAFVAPDVEWRYFADSVVPAAQRGSRRVALYTSGRDRVLQMARTVHDSDRAGQTTRVPLVRDRLETVDATDGLVAEGWITARIGTHHAIRRASAALFDLTHVVGDGFTAECRTTLGTARRTPEGVWQLNRTRSSADLASRRCVPFE
jgi:esterase/lipase superfamily enzyme